jgi:Ni/Fe-hydrogenase subunit HybB-like protein
MSALYFFIFITFNRVLVGVSAAGLVFASIINVCSRTRYATLLMILK